MTLRELFRTPGVAGPLAASLVANLPVTAIGLVLILHVEELTGRFAPAGIAAAAFALGLGVSAPVVGRLIDRRGQVPVIVPLTCAAVITLVVLTALPDDAPVAVFPGLGGLLGLTMPPGGSVVRALWSTEIADDDRRHALFALHNAGVEGTYILGPVLLAGALAAVSTRLALGASAALVAVGIALYVAQPGVRAWRGSERTAGLAGPLASPAVRAVLVTLLLLGVAFGSIEVGVAAVAEASGHESWAGPLLGAWGLGSMLGALAVARRPAPADQAHALVRRLVALSAAHALLPLGTEVAILAPLMLVAGATLAPALTVALTLLGTVAPQGSLTEAFSWSTFCIGGGLAVGAGAGGLLADQSARGPFLAALAAIVVATAAAGARSRTIAAGAAGAGAPPSDPLMDLPR